MSYTSAGGKQAMQNVADRKLLGSSVFTIESAIGGSCSREKVRTFPSKSAVPECPLETK